MNSSRKICPRHADAVLYMGCAYAYLNDVLYLYNNPGWERFGRYSADAWAALKEGGVKTEIRAVDLPAFSELAQKIKADNRD